MNQPSEQIGVRPCGCSGCGAPHHRTGSAATARWYLDSPARPREEVCGTCANRRTTYATRSQYLTPIAGLASTRVRLVGKVVAGLEVTGVPLEDGVVCECYDPDCRCGATCTRSAIYLWGGVEHDDWQYLCRICCLRLVDRGTAPDRGEEVAEDASPPARRKGPRPPGLCLVAGQKEDAKNLRHTGCYPDRAE